MAINLIRFARVTEDLHDTIPSWPLSPTPFLVEYLQYSWFSVGEKGEMLNFHQALEGFQNRCSVGVPGPGDGLEQCLVPYLLSAA